MEWKINNWFMKTLFVLGSISGLITAVSFLIGFMYGLWG
jgi:hypothetical protein